LKEKQNNLGTSNTLSILGTIHFIPKSTLVIPHLNNSVINHQSSTGSTNSISMPPVSSGLK
jgi:hypothetical protein